MQWLDIVSRIVHIGTAITLVGGSAFILLILMPSTRELAEDASDKLSVAVMGRWKRFVHGGIALFLLSGLYNYVRAIEKHKGDGLYHGLVGTKMLLALGIFFLAAALVGRSPALQGIRANRGKWLKVLLFLAAVVVCISGYVKVRG
tara:strand:+ start:271169 stop:271606 length:438 start_codon:yes stop_codon:yes gene_type:complete